MKVFIAFLFACIFCLTIEACEDKHKNCAKYKKKGKCEVTSGDWKRFMDKSCQFSCGCRKDSWCFDKRKDCKNYKGKCSSSRMSWKKWLNKNCRKTCGCHQPIKGCGIQQHEKTVRAFKVFGQGNSDRIVGGKNAKRGELPWQVGIWYTKEVLKNNPGKSLKGPFCGGTLIAPNVIVTAAHCFMMPDPITGDPPTGKDPKKYSVVVGDLDSKKNEGHQKRVAVKQVICHRRFSKATYFNDIALLILNEDVAFSKDVLPICIPDENTFKLSGSCTVSGWGYTSEGGKQASHLQLVKLPHVSRKKCDGVYQNIYKNQKPPVISDKMVCAGYDQGKKDACQGDSGGPMACPFTVNGEKRFYLSGIVSFGDGCARANSYGVYTNTFKFINWIREKLKYEFF